MRREGICAVVVAALSASWPAVAQQKPEVRPPQAPRPAVTSQSPAAAPAPAGGQPTSPSPQAQTAPPQPQPVRTEILAHDNWTVTCREFADKKRTCSGLLQVVQSQNNQTLFVWIIGRNTENKLMSVLQTPTGVAIAPGVEVKLAKGAARKAAYVNCETNRCEATLDLDDAFARDAAASETVEATVYSTSGQGVKFNLPFKGFDKALAGVR